MADIIFDKLAQERYNRCKEYTEARGDKSLSQCIGRLAEWVDCTIFISNDFDEMSFFFREIRQDSRPGLCGGIIYHGPRDGFGSGSGPTFSVCLEPTQGYSIHT